MHPLEFEKRRWKVIDTQPGPETTSEGSTPTLCAFVRSCYFRSQFRSPFQVSNSRELTSAKSTMHLLLNPTSYNN